MTLAFVRLIAVTVAVWFLVATFVFSLRHPWATDMEIMMNFGSVLTFQKVPYEAMRPREK